MSNITKLKQCLHRSDGSLSRETKLEIAAAVIDIAFQEQIRKLLVTGTISLEEIEKYFYEFEKKIQSPHVLTKTFKDANKSEMHILVSGSLSTTPNTIICLHEADAVLLIEKKKTTVLKSLEIEKNEITRSKKPILGVVLA